MGDQFAIARGIGRDDRNSRGHCFQHGTGLTILRSGVPDDIDLAEDPRHIGPPAQKMNAIVHPVQTAIPLQRLRAADRRR